MHVLGQRHEFEMVGVNAERVAAEMIDRERRSERVHYIPVRQGARLLRVYKERSVSAHAAACPQPTGISLLDVCPEAFLNCGPRQQIEATVGVQPPLMGSAILPSAKILATRNGAFRWWLNRLVANLRLRRPKVAIHLHPAVVHLAPAQSVGNARAAGNTTRLRGSRFAGVNSTWHRRFLSVSKRTAAPTARPHFCSNYTPWGFKALVSDG